MGLGGHGDPPLQNNFCVGATPRGCPFLLIMKSVKITKSDSPNLFLNLKVCDSFFTRLRGLMLTGERPPDGGIMIVEDRESKVNTSIHMMFMRYDITVL